MGHPFFFLLPFFLFFFFFFSFRLFFSLLSPLCLSSPLIPIPHPSPSLLSCTPPSLLSFTPPLLSSPSLTCLRLSIAHPLIHPYPFLPLSHLHLHSPSYPSSPPSLSATSTFSNDHFLTTRQNITFDRPRHHHYQQQTARTTNKQQWQTFARSNIPSSRCWPSTWSLVSAPSF